MQGPKGNRLRRSSERPDYLGIFAAAVLGATVTGNEKLQALQRKTQATVSYAYRVDDDTIASISAQRTNHASERLLTTSLNALRIGVCPKGTTYKVHANAFCRKKYIMNVTGIFMHGLYNKFEYPNFDTDPKLPSRGFKFLEKQRTIHNLDPALSKSGMRKVVGRNTINKPVDRTFVDNSVQALTLYRPGQADEVKSVWKEFGIDLSDELFKLWEYEFYLAGHLCMVNDTKALFLPLQFATAILQICKNLRQSWRSWSQSYNNKFPGETVDISYVMEEQKRRFADFARFYLHFYDKKKTKYQDCDGCGPLGVHWKPAIPSRGTACSIACCHCAECEDTDQNGRTEIFENLVKEGMIECSGYPNDAALADCKKQVSLSLSCWLQECINSDYFEFTKSEYLHNLPNSHKVDKFYDSDGQKLRWKKSFYIKGARKAVHVKYFDLTLPDWFYTNYCLKNPPLPTNNDNVPPEETPGKFTIRMLRDGMNADRDKDKEATWIAYMFPVPVVVDDLI